MGWGHQLTRRLALRRRQAVIGVHLDDGVVTMAVVRSDPLRLIAIGRRSRPDGGRRGEGQAGTVALADDVTELARFLRAPRQAPVVVVIEPSQSTLAVFDEQDRAHDVPAARIRQIRAAMGQADLPLAHIDLVPAALARLARIGFPEIAVVRGAYRWKITTGLGYTEAARSIHDGPRLSLGTDVVSALPIDELPLEVPTKLTDTVDPDRDAPAVGAALAALGLPPLVSVRPGPTPARHE